MSAFVVDVNVAMVANVRATHADRKCVTACVDALDEICRRGIIVLDDGMRILSEYMNNLSMAGQPGVGDAFLKWVWENQAVATRCEKVTLECRSTAPDAFVLLPDDPDLRHFDPSDRKYVAAALASRHKPDILNAVDTDWWTHREALRRNGVRLRFLCPQHMR